MTDLTENVDFDDTFASAASDPVIDQSGSLLNVTFNGTSSSINDNVFGISNETMRLLFIVFAVLVFAICLVFCIAVCVCICLNRRRKTKRPEKKDRLLKSDSSEKRTVNKSSNYPTTIHADSSNVPSSNHHHQDKRTTSPQTTIGNTYPTSGSPFYYDNLDDIPFIDESRPTSIIDMTRV